MAGPETFLGMTTPELMGAGLALDALSMGFSLFGGGESEQQQALAAQQRALARAQLGTRIDAEGNQEVYDAGTNTWRVIPTATSRALIEAENNEKLKALRIDDPLRRAQLLTNAQSQAQQGALANALLSQYKYQMQQPRNYVDEYQGLIGQAQNQGINKSYEKAIDTAAKTGLRTGSANLADSLTKLAQQEGQDLAASNASAALQARTLGMQEKNSTATNILGQYLPLEASASTVPNVQTPSGDEASIQAALNSMGASNSYNANSASGNLSAASRNYALAGDNNTTATALHGGADLLQQALRLQKQANTSGTSMQALYPGVFQSNDGKYLVFSGDNGSMGGNNLFDFSW